MDSLSKLYQLLEEFAGKELKFILTSTDEGYAADPTHPKHREVMRKLVRSIVKTLSKTNPELLEKATPTTLKDIVKESLHYKLAQICKSASSWGEFKEMSIEFCHRNPRSLLKLGGFKWKVKFQVPEKRRYTSRRNNVEGSTSMEDRLAELERRVASLEAMLKEHTHRIVISCERVE